MRFFLVACCLLLGTKAEATGPVLATLNFTDSDAPVQTNAGDLTVRLSADSTHEDSAGADAIAEIRSPHGDIRIVMPGDESPSAQARVVRLASGAEPQVLFQRAASGSSACVDSKLAVFDGAWRVLDLDRICEAETGYEIVDINGDGLGELVSTVGYLDVFANHPHGSHAPIRIQRLGAGRIVVATAARRYRDYLRKSLPGSSLSPPEPERSSDPKDSSDFTGPADWMATKALLGEGTEAWTRMQQKFGKERGTFEVCAMRAVREACPKGQLVKRPFLNALALVLVANNYVKSQTDLPLPPGL